MICRRGTQESGGLVDDVSSSAYRSRPHAHADACRVELSLVRRAERDRQRELDDLFETTGAKETFQHDDGLLDYLKSIAAGRGAKAVHDAPFTLERFRRDHVLADAGSAGTR